ncbi:hypothetical protein IDH44_11580 [Paenibacillus sp. IB182496]|uniref:Uncharacterized protein n=1 Tax=Paenibacillus sabuli TaxID=2772509 RepID=A0A927BS83_9BACL|nr:DUF6470 family protein [Paenibacillus sabuli]MBD2845833.1 hypothetical protein [Paenibacillus sabuli]
MKMPIMQADTKWGRIGIQTQPGQYEIRTHRADVQVETTPAQVTAVTPLPELSIDQSKAWEALNGGKPMAFWNRIYSQIPSIVQQNIARIVERGNQMADFRLKRNPIPDMAFEQIGRHTSDIEYFGPPSVDNVDLHFTVYPAEIDVELGTLDVQVTPRKPDITYHRGNVNVYMEQYPSLHLSVLGLDARM